jgi:hypothetical protein
MAGLDPAIHWTWGMAREVSIDVSSGDVQIADLGTLSSWQDRTTADLLLHPFATGSRNHGNGYEWLYVKDFSFGGRPCGLALCFFDGRLEQLQWSLLSSDSPNEASWPTRETIDDEIKFVSAVLDKQLGNKWKNEPFVWGQV